MAVSTKSPDNISAALAANRLGVGSVVYFVMSAAAPLTVVAGAVTTGYAVTGVTGLPIAFLALGVVFALFAVGYVAMSRHVANAGAFYAYISSGLGRPAGVGAAWTALIAYNALQIGVYGALGATTPPLLKEWFNLDVKWWVVSLAAWALVSMLGLMRVDVHGVLLAVMLTAEIVVIVVFDIVELGNPAGGVISTSTLSPSALFTSGVGAALVIGTTGFVGFESSAVFAEESRDPHRTVPMATFVSIGIIAALYAVSSWAMTVATGPGNIVDVARKDGPETIFNLVGGHLNGTMIDVARVLFLTSLLAAGISFHNTIARYVFALGRERVLPSVFGRTGIRTGAPKAGSVVQSTTAFIVIVIFAILGLDPLVHLFFYTGTFGGFGVLLLLAATSVAILAFFGRSVTGESAWQRIVAPGLATLALAVIVYLAVVNFATLLGVKPGATLSWLLPSLYVIAAALGVIWALILRVNNPEVYARIGLGAKAGLSETGPVSLGQPSGLRPMS